MEVLLLCIGSNQFEDAGCLNDLSFLESLRVVRGLYLHDGNYSISIALNDASQFKTLNLTSLIKV